jgi:hypothetical protein
LTNTQASRNCGFTSSLKTHKKETGKLMNRENRLKKEDMFKERGTVVSCDRWLVEQQAHYRRRQVTKSTFVV